MEETKDQDQTPVEQTPVAEQSETTTESGTKESKAYRIDFPDGTFKEMSPDELYDHYQKIGPEFNKRSQELASLKREREAADARNKRSAEESIDSSKLLESVDPSVKDAIKAIVSPVIQEALSQRDRADEEKRTNQAFENRLKELESKYPGGNGLPKFDKLTILREMQKPSNEIYDPEALYQKLNWDSYIDYHIKSALKGKAGDTSTESTSTEAPRKPGETKPAGSWNEASNRAKSRI